MLLVREINDGPTVSCSADLAQYLEEFGSEDQEHFVVVGLDSKNRPTFRKIVALGSVNECRVEPRETFKAAIVNSSVRIVLAHNHPSGDSTPSPMDIALTRRLVEAGKLLGIPVLDHLILVKDSYVSFRDLGLLRE